jgi:hypothetical protein
MAMVTASHLALVAYFVPRRMLSSAIPVLDYAFGIEAYRVARMRVGLELFGRPWTYDPLVLAGQIGGFTERLGTRVFLFGVLALGRVGVAPARAFDAIVVAHHAVFPLIGYAAARAFALSRRASTVVTALWSMLWFFDSLVHVAWFSGRAPWDLASGVVVLSSGFLYRALTRGGIGWALSASAALAVAMLVHPVAGVFGVCLGGVATWRPRGILPSRRLAAFVANVVPLALLTMPGGIPVALSSEPVAPVFRVGPSQILWDTLDLLGPGYGAPGVSRTILRSLCLVAGAVACTRWRAVDDRRWFPLSLASGVGLALAYFGGLVRVAWPLDPYLFLVPATLAASLPAASLVAEIPWFALVRRGAPRARIGLALAALVVVPRLFRTVASYVPELLPERVLRSDTDLHVSALVGLKEPMPNPLRHEPPPVRFHVVAEWLSEHAAGRGRIVVDEAALTAFLAITTPLEVVGPIGERGSPSADADPSLLLAARPNYDQVHAYLTRYAVGWVVLGGRLAELDRDDPYLEPPLDVAGFRVRRVVPEPSFFAEGKGSLEMTGGGGISVTGARGTRVTLRFHYDPHLVCRPDCRVERSLAGGDRAGFVSIPSPPQAFDVRIR